MLSALAPAEILMGLLLAAGSVDDLLTKKIHNWLVLLLFALALAFIAFFNFQGLPSALLAATVAFAVALPLAWIGAFGGGDLKLFVCVALLTGPTEILELGFAALAWAAAWGIAKALLSGSFMGFLKRLGSIATLKPQTENSQYSIQIPFSVALFLAWVSTYHAGIGL